MVVSGSQQYLGQLASANDKHQWQTVDSMQLAAVPDKAVQDITITISDAHASGAYLKRSLRASSCFK